MMWNISFLMLACLVQAAGLNQLKLVWGMFVDLTVEAWLESCWLGVVSLGGVFVDSSSVIVGRVGAVVYTCCVG